MASVNKVILLGHLGKDPEVRYMPNGEAVCNFSMATTNTWKDKSGQKQEATEWHNIIAYRRIAEVIGEYCKKGKPIYVEGKLQTRKWEKDGITRWSTEIIVESMQLLGGRESSEYGGAPEENSAPAQQPAGQQAGAFDNFEDDIPF